MDELTALSSRVRRARKDLERRAGEARAIATTGQRLQEEIAQLSRAVANYEKAVGVLSRIGEERQLSTQAQIESLVTRGLHTIFGEELSFHMVQSVRAKMPTVDFLVRTTLADGRTVDTDLLSARGGGLVSVVGFLLRTVILLLSRSKQDTVLFLDETFAMLSQDYVPAMAEFLRELVDKTGVQIVMVTHQAQFSEVADKRYEFSQTDGWTKVREL